MRHRTDATRWAIVYYGGSCCLFLLFPLARCHGSLDSSPVTAKAAAACIDSGRWFAATLPYLTLPQSLSHSRYPRDSLSASPASFYVPLSQPPSVSPDSCTLLAHSLLCSLHPHITVLPSDHFTLKSAPSPRASLFNFSTTPNSHTCIPTLPTYTIYGHTYANRRGPWPAVLGVLPHASAHYLSLCPLLAALAAPGSYVAVVGSRSASTPAVLQATAPAPEPHTGGSRLFWA